MPRRAYRVDPASRTVEAIAFQDYKTARQQIGTENMDHAVLRRAADDTMLCLFVDGDGYYKPGLSWWRFADYEYPLPGTGVIYGADAMGEDADVPLSLAEVTALVSWLDGRPASLPGVTISNAEGVIAEVDFNAPDAPTSAAEMYQRLFGHEPPRKKSDG
jgi:hypothetical protein